MPRSAVSRDVVGYRALSRHGELGVVVDVTEDTNVDSQIIVVRGGVSDALTYFVPAARVRALSPKSRTVRLEVDLTEFFPRLRKDGTVELRAAS